MKINISPQKDKENFVIDRGFSDLLKIISCLMVASSHYAQYIVKEEIPTTLFIKLLSTQGGYLGVSIFFFLSGYGLMCSYQNKQLSFWSDLKKRILKVYIPAVIISIIWIFSLCCYPSLQYNSQQLNETITFLHIPKYVIGVFALQFYDSVLWFVKVILLLYLFFYTYLLIKNRINKYVALFFLVFSSFATCIITYYTISLFAVVSIPLFAIGILISEHADIIISKRTILFTTYICIILTIGYIFRNNMFVLHGLINYVIICLALYCLTFYSIRINGINPFLTSSTYYVYLIHKKILFILITINSLYNLTSFLIISIIISLITSYISKKIPYEI